MYYVYQGRKEWKIFHQCEQSGRARPNLNYQQKPDGLPRTWIPNVTKASPIGPKRLAKPKQDRQVKIDPEWPRKPNKTTLQELVDEKLSSQEFKKIKKSSL